VDYNDNVWVSGSGVTTTPTLRRDDMVLKFTNTGKFLLQIGGRTLNQGNFDTKSLNRPADVVVYQKTNELFVGDGYGNRRVIVYDADTGAFKRMWGAFGNPPDNGPPGPASAPTPEDVAKLPVGTEERGSPQFGYRIHGLKISNDGLVYVADRVIKRVQVFTLDGKYVTQVFINRKLPSFDGTASGLDFSSDPEQQFLYVADYGNSHVVVLNRKTLDVLYQFGSLTAKPGDLQHPHNVTTDSKGNLYVAEVSPGNRAQKFVFKGLSSTPPTNALTAAQLAEAPAP
jgi:DNA-binding beta-propeller fold protein YncE